MSQISTTFAYNGAEFEFDIRDADDSERYDTAMNTLKEEEKSIPKDGKVSDAIRSHCVILRHFFDACLEEGAGVKICGEKYNIALHYDAYDAFLSFAKVQSDDVVRAKNVFSKYSNRQQRRAADKKSAKKS